MLGAKGNKKAIIAANEIYSKQLRIANIVKEVEKEENEITYQYAYIEENRIIMK